MMLPHPHTFLPSAFARCLAAVPKMLALPFIPPQLLLMNQQRYEDPLPCECCEPEPEYIIRIYVPEIPPVEDQNKSVTVLQQTEEPNAAETTPEASVPEKPSEGPQENHGPADEDAVLENAQEPPQTEPPQPDEPPQSDEPQTTPVPEVLKEEGEEEVGKTTETPDAIEDKDISLNKEGKHIKEESEIAPRLVKDPQEKTDELKAAENEIEHVKTQEMKKEKEDKIDEGNSKVDVLKADLYQISDPDQSLTSNSL